MKSNLDQEILELKLSIEGIFFCFLDITLFDVTLNKHLPTADAMGYHYRLPAGVYTLRATYVNEARDITVDLKKNLHCVIRVDSHTIASSIPVGIERNEDDALLPPQLPSTAFEYLEFRPAFHRRFPSPAMARLIDFMPESIRTGDHQSMASFTLYLDSQYMGLRRKPVLFQGKDLAALASLGSRSQQEPFAFLTSHHHNLLSAWENGAGLRVLSAWHYLMLDEATHIRIFPLYFHRQSFTGMSMVSESPFGFPATRIVECDKETILQDLLLIDFLLTKIAHQSYKLNPLFENHLKGRQALHPQLQELLLLYFHGDLKKKKRAQPTQAHRLIPQFTKAFTSLKLASFTDVEHIAKDSLNDHIAEGLKLDTAYTSFTWPKSQFWEKLFRTGEDLATVEEGSPRAHVRKAPERWFQRIFSGFPVPAPTRKKIGGLLSTDDLRKMHDEPIEGKQEWIPLLLAELVMQHPDITLEAAAKKLVVSPFTLLRILQEKVPEKKEELGAVLKDTKNAAFKNFVRSATLALSTCGVFLFVPGFFQTKNNPVAAVTSDSAAGTPVAISIQTQNDIPVADSYTLGKGPAPQGGAPAPDLSAMAAIRTLPDTAATEESAWQHVTVSKKDTIKFYGPGERGIASEIWVETERKDQNQYAAKVIHSDIPLDRIGFLSAGIPGSFVRSEDTKDSFRVSWAGIDSTAVIGMKTENLKLRNEFTARQMEETSRLLKNERKVRHHF